jgi:hypothetical protein
MASSMSTPINQLPNNVSNEIIKQNSHQLEDPSITDVINEMEREVALHSEQHSQMQRMQPPHQPQHQQPPPQYYQPPPQHYQPQMPPPPNMMQPHPPHVQHIFQQQYPVNSFEQQNKFNSQQSNSTGSYYDLYYNKEHAQRAIFAAFIAAVVFYPFELGFIYRRIPYLTNMDQYDRAIRALFLAVTFYVILMKVNI